jgi:hypothetical protein
MKTFVLALALLAFDGSTTEMPIELWQFRSMAECVQSSAMMNKGAASTAKAYTCIEYGPSVNVARIAPQPAKRAS